jgi:hypothetical protein
VDSTQIEVSRLEVAHIYDAIYLERRLAFLYDIQPNQANKYSYKNNDKGKHPMTRTQWCRFQRQKKGGTSGTKQTQPNQANKYSYRNNYKGKHPMTRTQWRKFQRQKKLAHQNLQTGQYREVARRPAKERILPPN